MIIYEPRGKAAEYSPLAANLYAGCGHGCIYCYAPAATYKTREAFYQPARRKNVIEQLSKDAEKLRNDKSNVLLCFTCDPYQKINESFGYTRDAIMALNRRNIGATILTKGGKRGEQDFDILAKNPKNKFGVSLTCRGLEMSKIWEPGAALPDERIRSLKLAHNKGIETWVSFEPVLFPEDVYDMIKETHKFVDLYKVGKLNYHPRAKEINWPEFRKHVTTLLKSLDKKYYLKLDLRNAL